MKAFAALEGWEAISTLSPAEGVVSSVEVCVTLSAVSWEPEARSSWEVAMDCVSGTAACRLEQAARGRTARNRAAVHA